MITLVIERPLNQLQHFELLADGHLIAQVRARARVKTIDRVFHVHLYNRLDSYIGALHVDAIEKHPEFERGSLRSPEQA